MNSHIRLFISFIMLGFLNALLGSNFISIGSHKYQPTLSRSVPGQANTPYQGQNGVWYMQAGVSYSQDMRVAELLAGNGPDEFGYIWDENIALNWIDTSGGTDTGMSGNFAGGVGPISLPFAFKYYENIYSNLYISQYGFITFSMPANWEWQSQIPFGKEPNNVIAPYWTPTFIGTGGWVRYQSGGTYPNRYFAVEWHDLNGASPGNPGDDALYQFEAILYENSDIVFQYHTMVLGTNFSCGTSGIEDARGLDGLTYIDYCDQPPTSKAVRFYRPPVSARLRIDSPNTARLTNTGALESFQLQIINNGELGTDTYDLNMSSGWSLSLYAADSVTPLVDTDSDGVIDTGPITQGGARTIIVKVPTPNSAIAGDENKALITASSSINPSVSKVVSLRSIIPAPFAQIYLGEPDNVMNIDLVRPDIHTTIQAGIFDLPAYDPAITVTPNGNFLYVWTNQRSTGPYWAAEIFLTILDSQGRIIRTARKLTDLTGTAMHVFDYRTSIATAPNGLTGILWVRRYENGLNGQSNENIYIAIVDSFGNLVWGPTNLTNNTAWGDYYNSLNVPYFFTPRITSTTDGRFILAWDQEHRELGGWVNDIYYSIRAGNGNLVERARRLTNDTPGSWGTDGYFLPALASLSSNRAIVTWSSYRYMDDDIYYAILDSDGNIVKDVTNLSVDESVTDAQNNDVVQLADGRIIAVWEAFGCFPGALVPRIRYALLDANYNPVGSPKCLDQSPSLAGDKYISVIPDHAGHAILTWMDADQDLQRDLYYALLDNNGDVVTQPVKILRTRKISLPTFIDTSFGGNENAPYGSEYFADVPPEYWALSWINQLYLAGITGGCGTKPLDYCPDDTVTRAQMAVFLEKGVHYPNTFTPPNGSPTFTDTVGHWAEDWIEALRGDGITGGCGTNLYCPEDPVTRAQMAVFLLKSKYGSSYTPPVVGASTGFSDVPVTHWAAAWIKQLAVEGITGGCGTGIYCPESPVTRAQMAVFLVRTFGLP